MIERVIYVNDKKVEVHQELGFSHAGTVWDGALVLASYFDVNRDKAFDYFTEKSVLELGSGTGITGFSVLTFAPKRLFLTDLPEFIPILIKNQKLNQEIRGETDLQSVSLPWGDEQSMKSLGHIDTIVGSELAYDKDNIGLLIKTIKYFKTQNPNLRVVISYQKYKQSSRNLKTRLQQQKCFAVEEVDFQKMNKDCRDDFIGILEVS